MARRFSSGWELNTNTTSVEWTTFIGSPAISSSVFRSGTYAFRANGMASGTRKGYRYTFASASESGPLYFRFYIRVATRPSAENRIFFVSNASDFTTAPIAYFTIDNSGVLRLYDEDGQITGTVTLGLNQWYRVELLIDKSGSAGAHVVTGRVDGTNFATSSTRSLSTGILNVVIGANMNAEAQTAGDWAFDDVAINDSTGSFQNSWPGSGKIVHLKPNAAGDANGFATQVGGTAGSANNYTRVSEVTPDDATSYNESNTLNAEDLFNIESVPSDLLGLTDVKVVAVGVRFQGAGASSNANIKLEIEEKASGTIEQSTAINPTSSWLTRFSSANNLYFLVLYDLPGSSTLPWTKETLETAQIGYKLTATSTNAFRVSTLWLMVEYDDASFSPTSGAVAFGEQSPTSGEKAISYGTFDNGAGAAPSISGDADWGKLSLPTGAEARSKVYDFGDSNSRLYTLTRDVYGTGSGSATIQIRGSTTSFNQDDSSPSWVTYTGPTTQSWRYVQVRVVGA